MSDRGIKKWAPFKALIGQFDMIDEIIKNKNKVKKPILSQDKQEELDYFISNLQVNDEIKVTYYDDGEIKEEVLTIKRIDYISKIITFEEFSVKAENILDLSYSY